MRVHPRDRPLGAPVGRLRPVQGLPQDALVHARAPRQQLEVAVPTDRVGDGAQRGQDRLHEPLAAGDGADVGALGGAGR